MYIPNPIAFGAIKALAYGALGACVRIRALKPGHVIGKPVLFGLVRAVLGWVVGLPVWMFVGAVYSKTDTTVLIASLAIPRLVLSALLIDAFFKPRGGRSETLLWATASVLLATALDAVLLVNYQKIEWLRIGWC